MWAFLILPPALACQRHDMLALTPNVVSLALGIAMINHDAMIDAAARLDATDPVAEPLQRADACIALARILITSDSRRALAYAHEAESLIGEPSTDDDSRRTLACKMLQLKALYQLGRLDEAIVAGHGGMLYLSDSQPTDDMFGLLSRLTWAYADLGQFDPALGLNRRALAMARQSGNLAWEALAFSDLSVIYGRWEKPDEERDAILRAVAPELFAALTGEARALVCGNVAYVFIQDGDLTSALAYVDDGINALRTSYLLATRGHILAAMGSDGAAEAAYREAVAMARDAQDFFDEQTALSGLAQLLRDLGRLDEAVVVAREAAALVEAIPTLRLTCLEQLTAIYADMGDYRQAYLALQRVDATRRELFNEETDRRARASEAAIARYDAERSREAQLILREKNEQLQQLVVERDQALELQQRLIDTINELSAPLLPLANGVLALPIIGAVDGRRADSMMSSALQYVRERRTRALLLDITGVSLMETVAAAGLLQLARAVRLLGCRVVLVGVRPEIAQSLIGLGVDLRELTPRATLAEGLRTALAFTGKHFS